MQSPIPVLALCLNRGEQLIEPDPVEHLRPNAVDDSEGYLGSVLRRIDVHPKRALAEWRIDNLRDGFRNRANANSGRLTQRPEGKTKFRRRTLGAEESSDLAFA